jgi:hypothetical protein
MSYTDVFGGELIFPSEISYLAITTAVDIELQWPTEQQITGDNVVADVMDITTSVASLNIDMPDTRNTSTGNKTTINNVGGETFTVRDNTGGTIQSVAPGEQWVLVLTDNTTIAGTWTTFQLGAQVSVASASALAGAGIKAIGVLLNQKIDSDEEVSTPVTVVDGDRAKCLIYTSGAGVADLPSAGAVGNDWFFMLRNSGSGTLTVQPASGEIDGSANLALDTNSSCFIFTDGTNWFTIGLTAGSTIAFDFVSLAIPGSGDFVLSGANLDRIAYRFTGALTGNRKVVVPDTTQQYWCDNQTTGAFVLTIGTDAQVSPPTLDSAQTAIMYSNSIEVVDAVNAVSVMFPISIAQGGTGATNVPDAQTNLDVPPNSRLIDTGIGLTGGGDLSGDRTHDLEYVNLSAVAPAAGDFLTFQDIDDSDAIKKATITDVVAAAAAGGVNELVDTSANVRVRAELLGIAQVRSDGNVDAEVRLLEFAHSDGTPRALIGQPTASVTLRIANLMAGGGIDLVSGSASAINLSPAGTLRAVAGLSAQFDIFADGNTDTELEVIQLKDSSGNIKGSWGWTNTEAKMHLSNTINGQPIELRADAFGGAPRTLFLGDPDDDVKLFDAGVEVLRTLPAASGGAEANNTATGAGFERVLTTSDLGGGAALNTHTGITTITGLISGKTYLVTPYGVTTNRGNDLATLLGVIVRNGTTVGAGTLLAQTGSNININWHDGQAPICAGLIVVTTGTSINATVDGLTARYMSAVQLD